MDISRSNTLDFIQHRYCVCEMGLGFMVSEYDRSGGGNSSSQDR